MLVLCLFCSVTILMFFFVVVKVMNNYSFEERYEKMLFLLLTSDNVL